MVLIEINVFNLLEWSENYNHWKTHSLNSGIFRKLIKMIYTLFDKKCAYVSLSMLKASFKTIIAYDRLSVHW